MMNLVKYASFMIVLAATPVMAEVANQVATEEKVEAVAGDKADVQADAAVAEKNTQAK